MLKGEDATDAVCCAVALGWQVSRLRVSISNPTPATSASGDDRWLRRVLQIGVSSTRLGPVFTGTGLDGPDASKLKALGDASDPHPADTIAAFDHDAAARFSAADFRVGKAYSVGCLLSQLRDSTAAKSDLEAPLVDLRTRLQELRSVLKPHAAKGVIDSIDYWRAWAANEAGKPPRRAKADTGTAAASVLARQVRRWRGVLSGEKEAADLLSAGAYVTAGRGIANAYVILVRACARRWWPYLAGVALVVGGIAVPLIIWGRNSSSGVAAAIVTVLTGVGITGKGLSATLSKALKGIEDDLENAELDAAIGIAATTLPDGITPDRAMLARVPAPSSRALLSTASASTAAA